MYELPGRALVTSSAVPSSSPDAARREAVSRSFLKLHRQRATHRLGAQLLRPLVLVAVFSDFMDGRRAFEESMRNRADSAIVTLRFALSVSFSWLRFSQAVLWSSLALPVVDWTGRVREKEIRGVEGRMRR